MNNSNLKAPRRPVVVINWELVLEEGPRSPASLQVIESAFNEASAKLARSLGRKLSLTPARGRVGVRRA